MRPARIQKAGQLVEALVATNLATRLPSFAHGQAPPAATDPGPVADTPTRTDHHVPLAPPPAPPVVPPDGAAFMRGAFGAPLAPPAAPAHRFPGWRWYVGAGAVLFAFVATHLARPRNQAPTKPTAPATVVREAPISSEGLTPASSQ